MLDLGSLPEIVETKTSLLGPPKTFRCRVLDRSSAQLVVLFVSDRPFQVKDVSLPAGTTTFAYFWTARPYNVYHWMTPSGRTLGLYFNIADNTRWGDDHLEWRDLVVDVLARPSGPLEVLDEEETPADLDPITRSYLEKGKREVLAHAPALGREIEAHSSHLWRRLFRSARR